MRASPILPVLFTAILAAPLAATPAAAQTVLAQPRQYDPAPWWMREPILASLGEVRAELPPNRAGLGAAYQAIDRSVADATKAAADRVRPLGQALAAYGPERVRVSFTFSTRPLYAQYKDKDGNLQENQRGDKVDRYEVTAAVHAEVRDLKLVERVYATLLAAKPTSTESVYFNLVPDNATNAAMLKAAVADAASRARAEAADAGARLGAVKLIDPTGRGCQTDVLVAGAPRSYGGEVGANDVSEIMVTGERREAAARPVMAAPAPPPPPPPPPPGGLEPEAMQLPLQPPMQELRRQACVIYALGAPAAP